MNNSIELKHNILQYIANKNIIVHKQHQSLHHQEYEYFQKLQKEADLLGIKDINYVSELDFETCTFDELSDELDLIQRLNKELIILLYQTKKYNEFNKKRTYDIIDSYELVYSKNNNQHSNSSTEYSNNDDNNNDHHDCNEQSFIRITNDDNSIINNYTTTNQMKNDILSVTVDDSSSIYTSESIEDLIPDHRSTSILANTSFTTLNIFPDVYPIEFLTCIPIDRIKDLKNHHPKANDIIWKDIKGKSNYQWEYIEAPMNIKSASWLYLRPDIYLEYDKDSKYIKKILLDCINYDNSNDEISNSNNIDSNINNNNSNHKSNNNINNRRISRSNNNDNNNSNNNTTKILMKKNIHYFYCEKSAVEYFLTVIHNYVI